MSERDERTHATQDLESLLANVRYHSALTAQAHPFKPHHLQPIAEFLWTERETVIAILEQERPEEGPETAWRVQRRPEPGWPTMRTWGKFPRREGAERWIDRLVDERGFDRDSFEIVPVPVRESDRPTSEEQRDVYLSSALAGVAGSETVAGWVRDTCRKAARRLRAREERGPVAWGLFVPHHDSPVMVELFREHVEQFERLVADGAEIRPLYTRPEDE